MVEFTVVGVEESREAPHEPVEAVTVTVKVSSDGPHTQTGRHVVTFESAEPDAPFVSDHHRLPSDRINGIGGHGIISEASDVAAEAARNTGYDVAREL